MIDLKEMIEREMAGFLDWSVYNKSIVTTTSAKLFAEHVAQLYACHVADSGKMAAPAVQGKSGPPDPKPMPDAVVPEGYALIKLDPRTGKPLVTSEMKAKHIGEYWWDEEAPYYDENGDLHDHVARHVVPWSLCKEIYKSMAKSAMLSAQHAEQQPAPDVSELVDALEQAALALHEMDECHVALVDIVNALAAYRRETKT